MKWLLIHCLVGLVYNSFEMNSDTRSRYICVRDSKSLSPISVSVEHRECTCISIINFYTNHCVM